MGNWRLRVHALRAFLAGKAAPGRPVSRVPQLRNDPSDRAHLNGQSFLDLFYAAGHWETYVGSVIDEKLIMEIIDRPLENHGAHRGLEGAHYINDVFQGTEDMPLFAVTYESFAGNPGLHGLLRVVEKHGGRVVGYLFREKRYYALALGNNTFVTGTPKQGPGFWAKQCSYTLVISLPRGASWRRHV